MMVSKRKSKVVKGTEVFDTLAAGMRDEGYVRTGVQCREKTNKLKADYRKSRMTITRLDDSAVLREFLKPWTKFLAADLPLIFLSCWILFVVSRMLRAESEPRGKY